MRSLFRLTILALASIFVASLAIATEKSEISIALMTPSIPVKPSDMARPIIHNIDFVCTKTCGTGSESQSCTRNCKDNQQCNTYLYVSVHPAPFTRQGNRVKNRVTITS